MKIIIISCLVAMVFLPSQIMAKKNATSAEEHSLNRYYDNVFAGEKKTTNYWGALDSRSVFSDTNGELLFLDDQFANAYMNDQIQSDMFDLHGFWFKKIMEKAICPNVVLGENIDYIRYLYRLQTISYLFESLKMNHAISTKLGVVKSFCSLSYDEIFGPCRPVSDDMKKFSQRVYGKFANEISKVNLIQSFNKQEMSDWLLNFKKATSLTIDPIYARLQSWCYSKNKNCKKLSIDDVKKSLDSLCQNDRSLIQKICSEQDDLYGLSYIDQATELLQASNTFHLINENGMGLDCLRRYQKIFSAKEIHYGDLDRQFLLVYSHLIADNRGPIQGELFLPGALKEFDLKGLDDFLTNLRPPKAEPVIKVVPIEPKKIAPVKIVPIVIAPAVPVVKKIAEPKIVKEEKAVVVIPKISEFESAVMLMDGKKLESMALNMEKFKKDFSFTAQMIANLATPIKKFQTRIALNEMKSYDLLGSFEAPVGLIFLKYLIDSENHQGLFNIVAVLGDRFYVANDIEQKDRPIYVELRNDASTKNRWQIILVKSVEKK